MKTLTWILAVIGLFGTLFSLVKYVFLCSLRLDDALGQALIQFLAADSRKRYIVSQEISLRDVKSMPRLFGALFWDRGLVGYFSSEYHQSDFNRFSSYHVCRVVCPRTMRNRMIGYMRSISEPRAGDISVTLIGHAQEDCTLGFIDESKIDPPLLDPDEYLDIEEAVEHSLRTGSRIGLFLHGPPGIGKTSFVRYLAKRFTLPINIVAFTPEVNNQDILKLFSRVPRDSIILMEDVDNYLDGRKVSIGRGGQAKFSFDAIVNAIDGVYREYPGNVIVMTANDIMGIDSALVDRRGRFAFVRRFRDPSYERRRLFFGDDELAAATEGMNADRCYFVRRRIEIYGRDRGLEMLRSGDPELAGEHSAPSLSFNDENSFSNRSR